MGSVLRGIWPHWAPWRIRAWSLRRGSLSCYTSAVQSGCRGSGWSFRLLPPSAEPLVMLVWSSAHYWASEDRFSWSSINLPKVDKIWSQRPRSVLSTVSIGPITHSSPRRTWCRQREPELLLHSTSALDGTIQIAMKSNQQSSSLLTGSPSAGSRQMHGFSWTTENETSPRAWTRSCLNTWREFPSGRIREPRIILSS